MSSSMSANWINVKPGEPAFNVLSNYVDYFHIGQEKGEDVWLEGRIVDGEFIFNGRLFTKSGGAGTIIDNFPKMHAPKNWRQRRRLDVDGYELVDENDEVVFSYHVDASKICHVDVNLYMMDGREAAFAGQGGLIAKVPTVLGRNGTQAE